MKALKDKDAVDAYFETAEMELMYDDDYGFSAEAHVNGRSQILITANIIETMDKFKAAASLNTAGPHIMGTLNGRFLIVKNPYYPADKFTIVYRGDVTLDTGFVYAPYMPIMATQFLMGSDFFGHQGYATSYGKKLVAPEFFCNGLITHVNN